MTLSVLYPFTEEAYTDSTPDMIAMLGKFRKKGLVLPQAVVDRPGRISKLLKKERVDFDEIPVVKQVYPNDFYLKALLILMTSTLANFRYFRTHRFQAMHCFDLPALMMWGNAAKMYRVPYFVSLDALPKTGKLASLLMTDSKAVVCRNETLIEQLPRFARKKASVAPAGEDLLPFWEERYNLIGKPFSFTQTTGLLNK